jgi:hypothetical protein
MRRNTPVISAVLAMSILIHGGACIFLLLGDRALFLKSNPSGFRVQEPC